MNTDNTKPAAPVNKITMTPAAFRAAIEQQRQLSIKLWQLLQKIPRAERVRFARTHLDPQMADIIRYFDSIPADRRAKTILYVSTKPQTRETRLAVAARLAGWDPLLLYTGSMKYAADDYFRFHAQTPNMMQLIFAMWLFPGPLVHAFVQNGTSANLLCLTKHQPLALDLYDTRAGWQEWSSPARLAEVQGIKTAEEAAMNQAALAQERLAERQALATADGLTHRDMRVVYLHQHNGYELPAHNVFIHDPLLELTPVRPRSAGAREIHVVSVGSITNGDVSVLRLVRALCAAGVHVHAYFNPEQKLEDPGVADYWQLARQSPFFHIEMPVYGKAYWQDLQRYDFGLAAYDRLVYGEPLLRHTDDYESGCGSSRLTDYIQMNFPVILSPELRFQHFWARRFAPQVIIGTPEFFRNPRPVLEAALVAKATTKPKNLASIMVEAVVPRLNRFYTALASRTPGRSRPRRLNPSLPVPLPPSFGDQLAVSAQPLIQLAPEKRYAFAQSQLDPKLARFVQALAAIPPERQAKLVLFISVQPHTRETRIATAARLAGWEPVLIHMGKPKYHTEDYFQLVAGVTNWIQLVVLSWLFRGRLIHVFAPNGSVAELLCLTKNRPLVLDLYDTCSNTLSSPIGDRMAEYRALARADGIVHRDLRIKQLHRHSGYPLAPHNIFIHDPLTETKKLPARVRPDGEIRVVSVGWVATGEAGLLRVARALCAQQIHVHVYLAHVQTLADPNMAEYRELQLETEYFHLEQPVFGAAYWQELQRYDFGLAALDGLVFNGALTGYTDDYVRGCGSSRISDYIAANLGIILSPLIRFQCFWARRYGSAFVSGTQEFFANPRPVLEAALAARATAPEKDLTSIAIPAVARRLHKFYSDVAAGTPPRRRPRQNALATAGGFSATCEALPQVPAKDRLSFARAQLHPMLEALARTFASIQPDRLARTILFVSTKPQMRETRLAASARLAGWDVMLVHLGTTPYVADEFFTCHAQAPNPLQLILASWLFPGPLIHVFCQYGAPAKLLCQTKTRPVILDLYDTRAGWWVNITPERLAMYQTNPNVQECRAMVDAEVQDERQAIASADALTHRDLRIKHLHTNHGYTLPPHNLFLHDPLLECPPAPRRAAGAGEIRVVSVGTISNSDIRIIRIARLLCAARIHLHVYLNLEQTLKDPAVEEYRRLAAESEYFHFEKPVTGEAYWKELRRYDFGLSAFDPFVFEQEVAEGHSEDYLRGSGSSRLTDYIQMNLGVIVCDRIHFQQFWSRRYASVVVHGSPEFFANPRPVLEAALAAKDAAPPKDRSRITIQGVAPRLSKFYSQVIAAGQTPDRSAETTAIRINRTSDSHPASQPVSALELV